MELERHKGSCNLVNDRGECSCTPMSLTEIHASFKKTFGMTMAEFELRAIDRQRYCKTHGKLETWAHHKAEGK